MDARKDILEKIESPKWDECGKVYDWRNYVLSEIREAWFELSLKARRFLYMMAEERVSLEEWD